MSILDDEEFRIVNMDETCIFLEMGFSTKIDFKGNIIIEIDFCGREQKRIIVILSIAMDGSKFSPVIILKGEPGSTNKFYIKNKNTVILCQKNAWCDNSLFMQWINKKFLPYRKSLEEKMLLIFEQATSYMSNESLEYLTNYNIDFLTIPSYITSFFNHMIFLLIRFLMIILFHFK